MAVKPGYKQTEVGVIPEYWEVKSLGKFATIATGNTPPTADAANYGDEFLFVSPADLGEAKYVTKTEKRLSQKGFAISRRFPKDSILFVCIGSTIGKCGIASVEMSSNQQINAIFPSPEFSADFLYYAVSAAVPKVRSLAGEQAVPLVNKTQFSETEVVLPPLPEQRMIATALGDVDALLGALERLIAKKRDLKQAAMQQLLTGQSRLPGFEGEWEVVSMREVLIQSATYGIVTAGTFVQNGVKMLRGGDIADGRINTDLPMVSRAKAAEYVRTALVQDDVVIALVGYPGATAKIPDELIGANISRAVGLLRLNGKVTADFLVCFLNSPEGRRMVLAPSAGSAQQVVNLSALNKLQFTIPPRPEQTAIATVLTDMDAELAALEQRLVKTRALKQGMMQELLTGRTRLV